MMEVALSIFETKLKAVDDHLSKKCKQRHEGRTRVVFEFDTFVIKIPKNLDGYMDNATEAKYGHFKRKKKPDDIQYARTKLVEWNGIPILFMERVEHANKDKIIKKIGKKPYWVDFIDCQQVGFNKKDELVAYDFGCC